MTEPQQVSKKIIEGLSDENPPTVIRYEVPEDIKRVVDLFKKIIELPNSGIKHSFFDPLNETGRLTIIPCNLDDIEVIFKKLVSDEHSPVTRVINLCTSKFDGIDPFNKDHGHLIDSVYPTLFISGSKDRGFYYLHVAFCTEGGRTRKTFKLFTKDHEICKRKVEAVIATIVTECLSKRLIPVT